MTETQVHVEHSSETTVEITTELHKVEENTQTMETQQTQAGSRETSIHPTKDEIEDYEESQAKFRELWELKREKVRFV